MWETVAVFGEVEVKVTLRLAVSQSVSMSWCRALLWGPRADFTFSFKLNFYISFKFLLIALLFVLGRPLWREDGSVIYSAVCQWSESWRTRNQTVLSHLRYWVPFPSRLTTRRDYAGSMLIRLHTRKNLFIMKLKLL
jgi:hypothetical protein